MSPQIQTPITQRLLALKSAAAVKIGLLLCNSGGTSIATTPRILSKTLNCSYRAVQTAFDELASAGLIVLSKEGFSVHLRLNPQMKTDPTVYESNRGVYQVHSFSGKTIDLSTEDSVPAGNNNVNTNTVPKSNKSSGKTQNIAEKSSNNAPKSLNIALSADCTDEEEDNISSSSSKESVAEAWNIVAKALNDVFSSKAGLNIKKPMTLDQYEKIVTACDEGRKALSQLCPPRNFTEKVQALLEEIDLGSYWVLKQVLQAGVGLPEEDILNIVQKCVMHSAKTPAYIVKALTFRKVELASVQRKQGDDLQRLQYEIKLGEKLLRGDKLKFEQLAQSKHWPDFAKPLFDPLKQCCELNSEYRAAAEGRLGEMRNLKSEM